MKETSALGSALFAVALLGVIIGFTALASEHVDQEATPIFVKEIPPGYRDWKVVSVAHEAGFFAPKGVAIPTAVSVFPDELYPAPRSWAEKAYPKLIHYNRPPKGGHFAAWEQSELFVGEMRAAFKSLR